MRIPSTTFPKRAIAWLAPAIVFSACAGTAPIAPPVRPLSGSPTALRENWRATVLVERDDSILLTLPSGDRQLQRFHRSAVLTLGVASDGTVSLQLDSLVVLPPQDGARTKPVQATWTGRADDPRVDALRVLVGGAPAEELTALVRNLLPRFPVGGGHAELTWTDSSTGMVRQDIFTATERRVAIWTLGAPSNAVVDPRVLVRVRETYEQVGAGQQDGQMVTMTSQGFRSGTYYSTASGRVISAQLVDSASMLIGLADTRQIVPTLRYGRASVRFVRVPRDSFE